MFVIRSMMNCSVRAVKSYDEGRNALAVDTFPASE